MQSSEIEVKESMMFCCKATLCNAHVCLSFCTQQLSNPESELKVKENMIFSCKADYFQILIDEQLLPKESGDLMRANRG